MRHNNLRDFEVGMLSEIVNDMHTEPELQPVTGEMERSVEVYGEPARKLFLMSG